jgi:hypothetical protein
MEDLKRQTAELEASKKDAFDHKVRGGIDFEIRKLQASRVSTCTLSDLGIVESFGVVWGKQGEPSLLLRSYLHAWCDLSDRFLKPRLLTSAFHFSTTRT